jgi:hypothetical protein
MRNERLWHVGPVTSDCRREHRPGVASSRCYTRPSTSGLRHEQHPAPCLRAVSKKFSGTLSITRCPSGSGPPTFTKVKSLPFNRSCSTSPIHTGNPKRSKYFPFPSAPCLWSARRKNGPWYSHVIWPSFSHRPPPEYESIGTSPRADASLVQSGRVFER